MESLSCQIGRRVDGFAGWLAAEGSSLTWSSGWPPTELRSLAHRPCMSRHGPLIACETYSLDSLRPTARSFPLPHGFLQVCATWYPCC